MISGREKDIIVLRFFVEVLLDRQLIPNYTIDLEEPIDLLYHYTNLNGLIGIVENQCLFASDIRFLNDKSELRYAVDLIKEVIRNISSVEDNYDVNYLLDNISNYLPSNRYVTCFSTKGDLLQQWQAYAKNGSGVSIGFKINPLKPGLMPTVQPRKTIYNQDTHIEIIKLGFNNTLDHFKNNIDDWHQDKYRDVIIECLVSALDQAISAFKHPGFAHENEFRFFYEESEKQPNPKIHFRASNSLIVPYIKFETKYKYYSDLMNRPDNDLGAMPTILEAHRLLPIKEVYIGPGLNYEDMREGVSILLRENGYKDVRILKSELPYRP